VGVEEVNQDPRVRALLALALVGCYSALVFWYRLPGLSEDKQPLCMIPAWPLGPLGGALPPDHFWLRVYGYHLQMLCLLGVFWLWWARDGLVPLLLLGLVWLNELWLYLNDVCLATNGIHLQLALSLLLLLSRRRLAAARMGLVVGFWLLALGECNESWWTAALWIPVKTGAPGVLACRGKVLLDFCLPSMWWAAKGRWRQAAALGLSLLLLGWAPVLGMETAVVLLPILWLCGAGSPARPDARALVLLMLALLGGLSRFAYRGDSRLTGCGGRLGLNMLDANRQVDLHIEILEGEERYRIHLFVPWADRLPGNEPAQPQLDLSLARSGEAEQTKLPIRGALVDSRGDVIFNPRLVAHSAWTRALSDPHFYVGYARQLFATHPPDRLSLQLDLQLDGNPERFHVLNVPDFRPEGSSW
jgi:hypothetical protein